MFQDQNLYICSNVLAQNIQFCFLFVLIGMCDPKDMESVAFDFHYSQITDLWTSSSRVTRKPVRNAEPQAPPRPAPWYTVILKSALMIKDSQFLVIDGISCGKFSSWDSFPLPLILSIYTYCWVSGTHKYLDAAHWSRLVSGFYSCCTVVQYLGASLTWIQNCRNYICT